MADLVEWLAVQMDLDQAHAEKDLWALERASQGRWRASYGYNLPYSPFLDRRVRWTFRVTHGKSGWLPAPPCVVSSARRSGSLRTLSRGSASARLRTPLRAPIWPG
jgi:hypothetical protein